MNLRLVSVVAILAIAVSGLTGCKIKYDSDKGADTAFNAKTYVAEMWDSKVIPLMQTAPLDAGTLLAAIAKDPAAAGAQYGRRSGPGQPWSFLVKGQGRITAIDTASRHGTATVEVTIDGKPTPVVLQIGPVIFGTAIRDALPFIAFGDFVNQIDYAEVSRAFNDKATAGLAKQMGEAGGKVVSFAGAATAPSGGTPLAVTPVLLSLGGTSQ
jgi:predicted lipoprotein